MPRFLYHAALPTCKINRVLAGLNDNFELKSLCFLNLLNQVQFPDESLLIS